MSYTPAVLVVVNLPVVLLKDIETVCVPPVLNWLKLGYKRGRRVIALGQRHEYSTELTL
jgi:hypothetical protein